MKKKVFKRSMLSSLGAAAVASLFTFSAFALVLYGVGLAEHSDASEGRRILEDGLRRAAVTCYSVEGVYPESLSYIEENYNIRINRSKYNVFYEIEASNIFPDITVLENEEGF